MRSILKIAGSFIAVIVGAGFASGQEILLYFVSFGYVGIFGAIVSALLFAYYGMVIVSLGSKLQASSYRDAIVQLSGRYVGNFIDIVLILTLFGIGVVMIAGAGSIFEQQFGISPIVGSLLLVVVVIITMMSEIQKIITIIGLSIPILVVAIIFMAIYGLLTMENSYADLHLLALSHKTPIANSLFAAFNYVSFNLAGGIGMALLIGGSEINLHQAKIGGLVGGLGVGLLGIAVYVAIFSRLDFLINADMPLLLLMNEASDIFGIIMSIIVFTMIYGTAVSMFYAFVSRFFEMGTRASTLPIVVTVSLAFCGSFIGFVHLVKWFYPLIGYFGLILMGVLLFAPYKIRKLM